MKREEESAVSVGRVKKENSHSREGKAFTAGKRITIIITAISKTVFFSFI